MLSELQIKTAQNVARNTLTVLNECKINELNDRAEVAQGDDLVQVGLEAQKFVNQNKRHDILVTDVIAPDGMAYWGANEGELDAKMGIRDPFQGVDYQAVDPNTMLMGDRLRNAYECAGRAIPVTWRELLTEIESVGFSDVTLRAGCTGEILVLAKECPMVLSAFAASDDDDWCYGWLCVSLGYNELATTRARLSEYLRNMFDSRKGNS